LYLLSIDRSPGTTSSYRSILHEVVLRNDRKLAPSSIRTVRALIRGALRQATVWGWVPGNVARDTRPPTVRRGDIKLPEAAQVVLAIETACERDPDFGVFLRLAAATGSRRGECAPSRGRLSILMPGT
jgi:hypothetical protein